MPPATRPGSWGFVSEDQGLPIGHASEVALTSDFCDRRCPVTAADRVIRWTTAGAVVGVAAVAAVASYEHAYALVRAHGEAGGWPDWCR